MKVRGLAGRQKQNFFSQEEDEKIVKALQEALGSPGKLLICVVRFPMSALFLFVEMIIIECAMWTLILLLISLCLHCFSAINFITRCGYS